MSLLIGLVLFVLSLAIRAPGLGTFSWPDELTWLERSAAFVTALERGDLQGTYLADHPGVVPMWGYGGALYLRAKLVGDRAPLDGLAAEDYQGDVPTQLATAAWFTVICTSLTVAVAFGLMIPLLGRAWAALGGLLIALDPFYLTHSRVVHVDAILSSFMLLAVLGLLVYLKQPERRRFLFLSGFFGGLALLTKTPALFLVPLTALALGLQWLLRRLGRESWGRTGQVLGAFGLWLITVWATFLLLWPAAWTRPLYHIYRLFRASNWGAAVSHGSNFFLGQAVEDPGILFYPVVLPFRLSPLALVLLPVCLILMVVAWKRREDIRVPAIGLAFVFAFTVMISLAAKKGDRYLLPVYPMVDVVAAWTLMALVAELAGRAKACPEQSARNRVRAWRIGYGAALGVVLLSAVLWLRLTPYYGAYFNPLLGGGPVAARTFAFGQGEGLDQAAQYLNDKENGTDLQAVSFYPAQFRYNFDGMATSLRRGDWDRTWEFADYVVFYISQVQRKLPTTELVDFFTAQEPEHVARIGGVDFSRVYRSPILLSGESPALEQRLEDRRLGEGLGLVGYALSAGQVGPGEDLYTTLYWQALAQLGLDYEFEVKLVNEEGDSIWQQAGLPFDGHFPTSWWRPGRTMYDRYHIEMPADLAPGEYWLVVSGREPGSGQMLAASGPTNGQFPDSLMIVSVQVEETPE